MISRASRWLLGLAIAAIPVLLGGCGPLPGSSSGGGGSTPTGTVNTVVSDASTEDWASIDVKILSIALVPQGGGAPVAVYSNGSSPITLNLVQLDRLGEVLGSLSVPAGTYTGAILTIGANLGDLGLIASADPEAGFQGSPGEVVPATQIQITGATGASGSMTVPVTVNFDSPLSVTANTTSMMDLEFDLSHPAFIVGHVPLAGNGSIVWAVNFDGPVRRRRIYDVTRLVLRDLYGNVGSVSSDGTSISITRDFPVEPPPSIGPETPVATSQTLNILADNTNGTLFYDLDAKTATTISSFSGLASALPNKYVRIAARYQPDGALVAVRVWASSSFNNVWVSPEGHVLHVNATTDIVTVQNELGKPVNLLVDNNTQFFFRTPWNAATETLPIAQGPGFLAGKDLVRGFKIHASVDPTATAVPAVAQAIDIEIARYDGSISNANVNGFTYTRVFNTSTDNYTFTLPFISSSTPNGSDPLSGSPITGFKWWNFAFPTLVTSGTNAVSSFDAAATGGAVFGGTAFYNVFGETYATWNDPAAQGTWAAPWTVLTPSNVPLGRAATAYSNGSFTMTILGGANAATVNLNTTLGSATLVYQVDRNNGQVTINPIDITKTPPSIAAGTPVKVFGIPQPNGSITAYVVLYFTHVTPRAIS